MEVTKNILKHPERKKQGNKMSYSDVVMLAGTSREITAIVVDNKTGEDKTYTGTIEYDNGYKFLTKKGSLLIEITKDSLQDGVVELYY